MDNAPRQDLRTRRGSLSLSQTLSFDPPPPPADLEQIHASSSQTPGLTTFDLASPPSGTTEQLSLNKLYSRVKSVATAVRDAVGAASSSNGGSPTRSTPVIGGDDYFQNSGSRDSFVTSASDDVRGRDSVMEGGPNRPLSSSRHRYRASSSSTKYDRTTPKSNSGDYSPPAALRKVNVLAAASGLTTNPSLAPVTVFRDGLEDITTSTSVSRCSSASNLQNIVSTKPKSKSTSSLDPKPSFFGAVGTAVGGAVGMSPSTGSNTTIGQKSAGGRRSERPSMEENVEDYGESISADESLSSSDDDVVLLHSKLPGAGTIRRQSSANNGSTAEKTRKGATSKRSSAGASVGGSRLSTGTGNASLEFANNDRTLFSRPATSESATRPPAEKIKERFPQSGASITANPSESSISSHTNASLVQQMEKIDRSEELISPPSSHQTIKNAGTSRRTQPSLLPKISTDQSQLLPGFKIMREPSSDADSSFAGTTAAGSESRDGVTSLHRHSFNNDRGENGVYGTIGRAPAGSGSSVAVSQALRQLRMGNLTRDFWMKDEVCKDCFLCGSTFTTWRRKHHCRLCGQIFCSKCTTLISGDRFGHQGSMRVCSPCLEIVNDYQDESDSDEFSSSSVFHNTSSTGGLRSSLPNTPVDNHSPSAFKIPRDIRPGKTPLMAIPATRTTAANNPNRRSQILEINADIPSPPRPSSSRSMRNTSASSRPVTAASGHALHSHTHSHSHHRHQHSRSQHRVIGHANVDERAPFHPHFDSRHGSPKKLPAFHADSILDPDLAPYMSDDDMSGEEQMSIFATIAPPKLPEGSEMVDNPKVAHTPVVKSGNKSINTAAGSSGARRRAKSRSAGSLGAILGDSGVKSGHLHPSRSARRRSTNFAGALQQRPVTRGKSRGLMRSLTESVSGPLGLGTGSSTPGSPSPRPSRSASMRGPLAPSVELNSASLDHVRKLLRQLLQDSDIPNIDAWEKALLPILLKSTDDLNPDVRAGDDIDIRHYVKVKRIPGGKPCDTSYISGVVCTKNLALKSMSRNISHPRIVVVSFPIEYQRHQQQLMSLEPVIAQEREFLQNMVNRIVALRPTLLLVEENVSGLALQLLAQANVATAHHVKPSVIEAVARCAQADIFSSIDKLALSNFRLGRCARFDVKTYVHDDIPGRKKTFMYLSGCPKELGCTIVLRGGDQATLAIIKQITEMMVYVVYNLKLETCLMRDEFVVIPSLPSDGAIEMNVAQASAKAPALTGEERDKSENGATEAAETVVTEEKSATQKDKTTHETVPLGDDKLPDDIPDPTYYEDMVRNHETKILSSSPFVKYMQPYLLTQARGLERRLVYLRRLRDELAASEEEESLGEEVAKPGVDEVLGNTEQVVTEKKPPEDAESVESFQLVQPEMVHGKIKGSTKKMKEALRAIYDSEYDRALHVYETQKKQWENYLAQYDDLFDPFTHQSIAVLYSMVCTITTIPCEGPEIRRLEFYYQDVDWTLGKSDTSVGQFVEYLCDTAQHTCTSPSCDKKMIEHHRSYVHGQARVSVLVSPNISCPIQGMQNTILMWSYCKICPNTNTPAIPMSESSWKYSFGKYLELAFWSSEMKLRGGTCPHDLNRDHVRCFGYHGLTVVFQYDPIDLLEIVVPRTKITYKPEIDLRIKNEQYLQHEDKINHFFDSVKARLKHINIDSVGAEKIDACRAEIEAHLIQAETDRLWLVGKLQDKYNKAKYYEIIPLNRALRALQEKVVEWDTKFAAFDNNYFPSEKDIRRLATLQIKKMFLDNTSTPSLQTDNDPTPTQEKAEEEKITAIDGAHTPDASAVNSPIELTSKQAHDALASVVEEEHEINNQGAHDSGFASPTKSNASTGTITPDLSSSQELNSGEPTDDDLTPKQELPLEKVLSSVEGSDHHGSVPQLASEPDSPVADIPSKSRSTPAIVEPAKPSDSTAKTPRPAPTLSHMSSIPRLDVRRKASIAPPPLSRTVSVPAVIRQKDSAGPSSGIPKPPSHVNTMPAKRPSQTVRGKSSDKLKGDKKMSDKFRLSSLSKKPKDKESHIPRSIPMPTRRDTRVSSLAKHFEQLSKEFERERAREKRQLAAKRSRALPVATSRPIVEVYRNVREAVEELSEEESPQKTPEPSSRETSNLTESSSSSLLKTPSPVISPTGSAPTPEDHQATDEPHTAPPSQSQSDVDASDGEVSMISDQEGLPVPSIYDVLPPTTDSSQVDLTEELPKHKSAWMKMLSNFWAERSASGWTSLEYPLHPSDHVFNDSDIIVREDEPSSLIAFALNGQDYAKKLENIRNSGYSDVGGIRPTSSEDQKPFNSEEHPELERALLKTTGTHLKYQFQEGSARMFCKIFYAEQFDALRRNCGVSDRYVESLSRCTKWDSRGGKSRSVFLKSQDERIVLKSLSPIETAAFIKFAPSYFQYMSEAFFHELPTVIAKMLGFYQIFIKNPTTGVEIKWDILVMENLFYDRKTTRIFDLKGSMRNRRAEVTGDRNDVLLDENMVEFIYESPLFVREHSKKLLRTSLWNDTLFLSRQNVMDYSLMIGIDQNKELVVGIIDCIRTFTWDKKLESWVKEKGFAGGGRNKPTITSPREYKYRFREAMERYVLEAPSCWHLFRMNYMGAVPLQLQSSSSQKEVMDEEHRGLV